jgi:mannose-6-phosphate isomerase-like protein (cupin superfamily)
MNAETVTGWRVLGPSDGDMAGSADFRADRFMIDGKHTGGRIAVVEHTIGPGVLAGPMHRHSREDEYSYVITGRLGAIFDGQEVVAEPGDLVFKPRGEWHSFWNPGDVPTRILEIITPSGLEEFFRELGAVAGDYDPSTLPVDAARYGCEVDFEATSELIARHGLKF